MPVTAVIRVAPRTVWIIWIPCGRIWVAVVLLRFWPEMGLPVLENHVSIRFLTYFQDRSCCNHAGYGDPSPLAKNIWILEAVVLYKKPAIPVLLFQRFTGASGQGFLQYFYQGLLLQVAGLNDFPPHKDEFSLIPLKIPQFDIDSSYVGPSPPSIYTGVS